MEFRILGPLEVWQDGRALSIGSLRARSLLVILLLHPNQVLARDDLIASATSDRLPRESPTSRRRSTSQRRPVTDGRRAGRETCLPSPTGVEDRSQSRMRWRAAWSTWRRSTGSTRPAGALVGARLPPRPGRKPGRGAHLGAARRRRNPRRRHSRRTRRYTSPDGCDPHPHRRRSDSRDRAAGCPRPLGKHQLQPTRGSHAHGQSWPSWPPDAASSEKPRCF